MLTPEEIDAFNKATGQNVPRTATLAKPVVQSRADEIRAIGKATQEEQNQHDYEQHNPLTNTAIGIGKGALSTVRNVAALGEKTLLNPIDKLMGGGLAKTAGLKEGETSAEKMIPQETTEAHGTAQTLGKVGEQVGEFFVPGLQEEAGANIASKIATRIPGLAEKAPFVAEKLAPFIGKSLQSGIDMGVRTTLQSGSPQEGAQAGAAGTLIPGLGLALKGMGKVTSEVAKFMASKMSGVPKAAIEHAFENPEAVQGAIKAFTKEGADAETVITHAEDALQTLKKARREAYLADIGKVEKETMQNKNGQWYVKRQLEGSEAEKLKGYQPGSDIWVPTDFSTKGLKDTITKTLKDFGADAKGKELSFERVALPNAYKNELEEVVNKIYNWEDISPKGLDDLRENIGVYRKTGMNSAENKFNKIISDMYSNISKYVKTKVPQIGEMNQKYAVQSEVIDNMMRDLSLGKDRPATALRKLLNTFNPKSEVYRPLVEQLGEKSGQDLMSEIAGLTMSKWTPEGLGAYLDAAGLLKLGGAGLAGVLAPKVLLAAPLASPRIVGKSATVLGKVAKSPLTEKAAATLPSIGKGLVSQEIQKKE